MGLTFWLDFGEYINGLSDAPAAIMSPGKDGPGADRRGGDRSTRPKTRRESGAGKEITLIKGRLID